MWRYPTVPIRQDLALRSATPHLLARADSGRTLKKIAAEGSPSSGSRLSPCLQDDIGSVSTRTVTLNSISKDCASRVDLSLSVVASSVVPIATTRCRSSAFTFQDTS